MRGWIIISGLLILGCGRPQVGSSVKTSKTTKGSPAQSQFGSFSQTGPIETFQADSSNTDWNVTELNVSFGRISQLIAENYDELLNPVVRRTNCSQVKSKDYRCGELPFGDVVNSSKKRVITVDIKSETGTKQGFDYTIEGKPVHYYLERRQYRGELTYPSLDKVANDTISTSDKLGDDVFLRIQPDNTSIKIDACVVIPGMRTFSEPVRLNGTMKRDIWITELTSNITIDLKLGRLEFDSASVCGTLKASFNDDGIPHVRLISIDQLKYENLEHEGYDLEVKAQAEGALAFINSITSSFGYDIEEQIEQQIRTEVEAKTNETVEVQVEDIRSGRWAAKIFDTAIAKEFFDEFSDSISTSLRKVGFGRFKVRHVIKALCYASLSEFDADQNLLELCKLAPEIDIDPFHVDTESNQNGCYSYFFNPRKYLGAAGGTKWWNNMCKLSARIELEVDDLLKPISDCLIDSVNQQKNPISYCSNEIAQVIDDYKTGEFDRLLANSKNVNWSFAEIDWNEVNQIMEDYFGQIL